MSKPKSCKKRLSEKIAINMREGYKSPAQAIAVAYSQINKEFPHCKQHLRKSKKSKKSKIRKSPSKHAAQTKVGTKMKGNDGETWIVRKVMGGKRWMRN